MNKEQIKETILGKPDCAKEETPLCQFATFKPDMEMVEVLLKGADIQKAFNGQPLAWVLQFCEPNWDKMLILLFKYKYYALHLDKEQEFRDLLELLRKVKKETVFYVLKTMKKHNFVLSIEQFILIKEKRYESVFQILEKVFEWDKEYSSLVSPMNELTGSILTMDYDRAKELIKEGEDINEPYNKLGWTPFHLMVSKYHSVEVVEEFIKLGGDVNKPTKKGRTPVMMSYHDRDKPDVLELLLRYGADPNIKDKAGHTALQRLLRYPKQTHKEPFIKILKDYGAV